MTDGKTKQQMLAQLDIMLNEELPYAQRLEAYEFLLEDCEEIVDEMINRSYSLDGDTGKMLMEVLSGYKGNKAIFMGLVSYLYKGEDVALFARLIGGYGDEQGIEVLKTFCEEYEPNYNEFMELRNAVEELGGDFDLKEDFSDDPLYRYLKGLDEQDDRRSPFEDLWKDGDEQDNSDDDGCDCHCDDEDHDERCGGHDGGCHCHEHRDEEHNCGRQEDGHGCGGHHSCECHHHDGAEHVCHGHGDSHNCRCGK